VLVWTDDPSVVAQSAQSAPVEPLLQYGAIGVMALLALLAVAKLFDRQVKAHEKDTARADRLEEELRHQNRYIQERLVVELTKATEAMARLAADQQRRNR
jgi:hypothetical protein